MAKVFSTICPIVKCCSHRMRPLLPIPSGYEISRIAVLECFGHTSDSRGNHRKPRPHGFQHGQREPLPVAGEHTDLGRGQTGIDIRSLSQKPDPSTQSKCSHQLLHRPSKRTLPDEIELPGSSGKTSEGMEQGSVILLRLEPGDHNQSSRIPASSARRRSNSETVMILLDKGAASRSMRR